MKTLVRHLRESKITRAGLLVALVAAVAASIAWSGQSKASVKLGGTWVGGASGITWIGTHAPDPSGQNAVVTLQWMTLSADFEALLASVGATSMSMVSGWQAMTGPDTATGKLFFYAVAEGTPSLTDPIPGTIKAIAVMTSDWHFLTPDKSIGAHNLKMYLPDAQGSLVPADDAVPFLTLNFDGVPHQKIN